MRIDGVLGYRLLQCFPTPRSWQSRPNHSPAPEVGKLETYWGPEIWDELVGRTVIDYGCGWGGDCIEMARRGVRRAIGLDVRPKALAIAAKAAERAEVADCCTFRTTTDEKADAIICIDCFEHFNDPAAVLRTMAELLNPGGTAFVSFGPPWFHPYGGHSFSVFPWAHLLFSERSFLRWRSHYCNDGATRFHEVPGGLNQMTIRRFERLVQESSLRTTDFMAVPIRPVRLFHNRLTREFFTSIVRCKLTRKAALHERAPEPADESPMLSAPECFAISGH